MPSGRADAGLANIFLVQLTQVGASRRNQVSGNASNCIGVAVELHFARVAGTQAAQTKKFLALIGLDLP